MKKTTSLLLLWISVTICYSQNSGWETGVNASIGVSDQIYSGPKDDAFISYSKKQEKPALYYSTGVYGRKFFKKMYGVELGVNYTSTSITRGEVIFTDVTGNIIGKAKASYRENYLELPIRFVFKKDFKLISVGCFAGVAPAYLTHAYFNMRGESYSNEDIKFGKTNTTNSYKRFNLICDAGMLLRFNISEHFAIDAKPFFRVLALKSYDNGNNAFNARPFSGGLSASTVWKF